MDQFTIKDLENISGIKAHTLRIWEQRYAFLKPQRTATNIRHYTGTELKTILHVALLIKNGFKVSDIDSLTGVEMAEHVKKLSSADAVGQRSLNELITVMLDMNVQAFEQKITTHITKIGLADTLVKFIFPFLEKMGLLWFSGNSNPAQEHLVSNIIRQKMLVAIDAVPLKENYTKKALLFLPAGEHHELGLLFIHYLLKTHGVQVIYLGADVPMADIFNISEALQPHCLFTHLTTVGKNFNIEEFVERMSKFSACTVYVSGQFAIAHSRHFKKPFDVKYSLQQITEVITAL